MNNPSKLLDYTSGVLLFGALSTGYLVGSHQKETTQQVEVVVRTPYTGEILPLQNARELQTNAIIEHVSFKPTETTIFSKPPLQSAIEMEPTQPAKAIHIVKNVTGNTTEFSATCPNDAIIAVRKKILELLDQVDIKKIGLKNPSKITYTEKRLDDSTTKVEGSIASIEE